jgi:hypothetical protein
MAPTSREAYLAWKQNIAFDTAYPRFNPFIYSLENDLPLVKLAQDDKWAPDPSHKSTVWTKSNIPFRIPLAPDPRRLGAGYRPRIHHRKPVQDLRYPRCLISGG